jgi:hypothetical protein
MFLDSIDPKLFDRFVELHVTKRPSTGRHQRYGRYRVFKGIGDGALEYRDCVIPSPTSLLAEVWAMRIMSGSKAFQAHSAVYSYPWASPESAHVFAHFMEGFRRREYDVAQACRDLGEGACVVISDLSSFYRSIPMERLSRKLTEKLDQSNLSAPDRLLVEWVAEPYFSEQYRQSGVPVGPPLGHVLAQIYLDEADAALGAEFGKRYFRYVDDILVVCRSRDEQRVRTRIQDLVESAGLKCNPHKDDVVPSDAWTSHVAALDEQGDDPMIKIHRNIRTWSDRTGDTATVETAVREAGAGIPIIPLRRQPSGVLDRVKQTFYRQAASFGLRKLTKTIEGVRRALWENVRGPKQQELSSSGMHRRWDVQRTRFSMNRLLQLTRSDDEHSEILRRIPESDELRSLRAVARTLVEGDATHILDYPGAPTAMVARLWSGRKQAPMKVTRSALTERHRRDSLYTLWCYGAVTPDRSLIETIERPVEKDFARFCADVRVESRTWPRFSFADELQSLHMTASESPSRKLSTRNNEHEDVSLDDPWELFSG